jgi:predicted enzyme related to lactoylglutathione lyase
MTGGGNHGGSVGHLVPGRRHRVRREGCRRKRGPLPRRARLSRQFTYGEPAFYAGVERGAVIIHLQAASDTARQPGQAAVYIFVTGVDALYEELRSRGALVLGEPEDYAYGMRDFAITDLDGNELVFGMESTQAA